jgi:DNA-directed RNA polymerase specialized sigma24 family protein
MDLDPKNFAFPATQWTVVLQVRSRGDEPAVSAALSRLCKDYWYPLYAYARRRGYRAEDAQDVTQEFLAYALERKLFETVEPQLGKLRTFLLTAFDRHVADARERAARAKRGGGCEFVSLDDGEARYAEEPLDLATPAKLFERTWAYTVLDVALRTLCVEETKDGRRETFVVLQPFLTPDADGEADYEVAARKLGLRVEAVRQGVKRLRTRFREVLRRQIAQTLHEPSKQQIDEELAALKAALRG